MKHQVNLLAQFGTRYTDTIAPACDVRHTLDNLSVTEVVRMALGAMIEPDGVGFNDYHVFVALNAETLELKVYGNSTPEMGIIEAAHLIPVLRLSHASIMYSADDIIGDDWDTPEVVSLMAQYGELTYAVLREELSDFSARLAECVVFGMDYELNPIWEEAVAELYADVEPLER